MATRLEGKVAAITDAGSGIGRAIALGFAEEGATVAFLDLDEGAARTASAGVAGALAVDVAEEQSVAQAFEIVAGEVGTVDVIAACAGIQLFGRDAGVHELTLDAWQRTISVNLTGVFLTGKYAVRACSRRTDQDRSSTSDPRVGCADRALAFTPTVPPRAASTP